MKKTTILFFLVFFFSLISYGTSYRVLFIGNSYTDVNNLPQMVYNVSLSAGDTIVFVANAPGGCTFQQHLSNNSATLIQQGGWDYVVLQEQSQIPSFPYSQFIVECYPYSVQLNDLIEQYNPNGETVFYMTWGRKNGDQVNCQYFPPLCTYEGMDSLLYERYMMMTEDNDAIVSPVGAVWHYIRDNYPDIELYSSDESHPSIAGTYAAACTFYSVLFRKNPELITFNPSLDASVAQRIRQASKLVVYDSLSKWFVGTYDNLAVANFEYNIQELTVSFTNHSLLADSYLWDFGDGTTSTDENPIHTYLDAGTYQVSLTATNSNSSDVAVQSLVLTTNIADYTNSFVLYPNPAQNIVYVKTESNFFNPKKLQIFDLQGNLVKEENITFQNHFSIDVSQLANGSYFVKFIHQDGQISSSKLLLNR